MRAGVGRLGTLLFAGALARGAAPAAAGEIDVAAQVGASLPFYSQSFSADPNAWLPADIPVTAAGGFSLDASGGLSVAGGVTWFFTEAVGLEARVDSAAVDLVLTGGDITAGEGVLPPPFGVSARISGEAELDRLTTLSLNLRLRTNGRARVFVSGGLSVLPATGASATAFVQGELRLPGLPPLPVPALGVGAQGNLASAVGGNAGAGVEVGLSKGAALVLEGRGFVFPTRELEWGPASGGLSPIEDALASALEPIELRPGFFQVTGGLVLRF